MELFLNGAGGAAALDPGSLHTSGATRVEFAHSPCNSGFPVGVPIFSHIPRMYGFVG